MHVHGSYYVSTVFILVQLGYTTAGHIISTIKNIPYMHHYLCSLYESLSALHVLLSKLWAEFDMFCKLLASE